MDIVIPLYLRTNLLSRQLEQLLSLLSSIFLCRESSRTALCYAGKPVSCSANLAASLLWFERYELRFSAVAFAVMCYGVRFVVGGHCHRYASSFFVNCAILGYGLNDLGEEFSMLLDREKQR